MRPIQLVMQAFCSYGARTTVDFTKTNQNLFLITGDTGAGKSTIFDAIVFALYGEASSGENKKSGRELQSQFVGQDQLPFVELTFSETEDGLPARYTVRREPRHLRPLKRGTGSKEEGERVTLLLPDGREFSQNREETNRKLEELVGLTKSQFMQVAMIAQGEFMELLRATSNNKKEIFRKLFHTEVYSQVVEELNRRCKEKRTELAEIRTVCQTELGHVVLPVDETALEELRQDLLRQDKLNIAQLESFLAGLQPLCSRLEEESKEADAAYVKAAACRDEAVNACTRAKQLLTSFAKLEQAKQELQVCQEAEASMKQTEQLLGEIESAWEIQAVHQRLSDAEKTVQETQNRLAAQELALPELQSRRSTLAAQETQARTLLTEETERCSKVEERVARALSLMEKARHAEAELQELSTLLEKQREDTVQAEDALKAFDKQVQLWREQEQSLAGTEKDMAMVQVREKALQALRNDIDAAVQLDTAVQTQQQAAAVALRTYEGARAAFAAKEQEYSDYQRAFLDAQAGFLAREQLRPGQPCPVCGSLEHPHPCELPEEHRELTRGELDRLSQEAGGLQEAQQKASGDAGTARKLLEEKQLQQQEGRKQLRAALAAQLEAVPETVTPQEADTLVQEAETALEQVRSTLEQQTARLRRIQGQLATADAQRQNLTNSLESRRRQFEKTSQQQVAAETVRKAAREQLDYDSESEACQDRTQARDRKQTAQTAWESAQKQAQAAAAAAEQAEALIRSYRDALPGQQEDLNGRKLAYETILTEKQLTEEAWQSVTALHPKAETAALRETLTAFQQRKATALGAQEAAQAAIGDQSQPDLEALEQTKDQAEAARQDAEERRTALRELTRANRLALDTLGPILRNRASVLEEANRLNSLWSRLSGNVTGGRMDIETFVQRCYMKRILTAANNRFLDMSGGQYELRLVDVDQAGQGKNRGLDLMVYSYITGQEREIRTLSGGESFLAALSLALGMADQIQESCSAIHLDIMFIDEGFGSLDELSRTQAVRILQRMAGGSRLIGIISHVTELKQQIEDQLIVKKGREGSAISWQIS